ncbi:MAG: hypothetical protein RLZZ209_956 [Bacteroidota bacterium]
MPRSVNHVASRARRKKILKLAKGFYGRGKNVWTVAKNKVEKGLQYAYRDVKLRKEIFVDFGFNVSMQQLAKKVCLIQLSWVNITSLVWL